jgi:hypothetical protein
MTNTAKNTLIAFYLDKATKFEFNDIYTNLFEASKKIVSLNKDEINITKLVTPQDADSSYCEIVFSNFLRLEIKITRIDFFCY